jgi:hypothetical protein
MKVPIVIALGFKPRFLGEKMGMGQKSVLRLKHIFTSLGK